MASIKNVTTNKDGGNKRRTGVILSVFVACFSCLLSFQSGNFCFVELQAEAVSSKNEGQIAE